jgi:hypothetical protein
VFKLFRNVWFKSLKAILTMTNPLPPDTEIELICIKGDKVIKTIMPYKEALLINKKSGWIYKFYQIGFSQFKI